MTINFKHRLIYSAGISLVVLLAVAITGCSKAVTPTNTSVAPAPATSSASSGTSPFQRPGVIGNLTAISGNTLTVSSIQGSQESVTINSGTQIQEIVSGSLTDLKQGDVIMVTGATDGAGNITASSIVIQPQGQVQRSFTSAPAGGLRSGTAGSVDSISGNTLTLNTAQGSSETVTVSSATTIEKTVSGTATDLHTGEYLTIEGTPDASGNMVATLIVVRPNSPASVATPVPTSPAATTPPATTPAENTPTPSAPAVISTNIPSVTATMPSTLIGNTPIILILTPSNVSTVPAGDVTISTLVSNFNLVNDNGQANANGEGHIVYYMDVYPPIIPGQSALTADGTYAESTATSYTWHNVGPGNHTFSAELVNNDNTVLTPAVTVTVYVTVQGSSQPTSGSSASPTPTSTP